MQWMELGNETFMSQEKVDFERSQLILCASNYKTVLSSRFANASKHDFTTTRCGCM